MQPNVWDDDRITAYVMGELSETESSQLESDIRSQPELASAVEEAREVTKQLSAMFAGEPSIALDAVKRDALRAEPVTLATVPNKSKWRLGTRFFILAASTLLVVTAAALLLPSVSAKREVVMLSAQRIEVRSAQTESQLRQSSVAPADSDEGKFERAYDSPAPTTQTIQNVNDNLSKDEKLPNDSSELTGRLSEEEVAQSDFNPNAGIAVRMQAEPGQRAKERGAEVAGMGDASGYTDVDTYGGGMGGGFGAIPTAPLASAPAPSFFQSRDVVGLGTTVENESLAYRGRGPGEGGDQFDSIIENDFRRVSEEPLSTFSIDVDTASYSKVRQFLLQSNMMPPAGAVRIEELVNYFDYYYAPPAVDDEHPFATRAEIAACPWAPEHRLVRLAVKGKSIDNAKRPSSNLVFLVDTSGSMGEPNKLPLVQQGLRKLLDRLGENDRVAIVVYAGSAGLVLESTSANDRSTILRKINQMQSGGSTNGGEGITLAYQVARDHFIKGGVNRVILCSDGDFNVGVTSNDQLVDVVEKESKGGIDITVLGFGMGNHNDSMMEQVSGRGNGNYAFIDSEAEADRVLVQQMSGTLVTIARDVKIQVEFNPAEVAAYRLIGYENRKLANEDFKDDTKDAGEIGAGHSVTALYELIPAKGDTAAMAPEVDELRYRKAVKPTDASDSGEVMTVKLRYKKPEGGKSIPVEFPVTDAMRSFDDATTDFRFAASVAGFGMLLRSSEHSGSWTLGDVVRVADNAKGEDAHGLRSEFVTIANKASQLRTGE